ncbi:retrotransposon protein [Cucumis melo var. makuwa]|uniref:Retrotransposon protein n=1 Tax=Cucumis melo var. makuwa TaxID=1194695 RepID=A0A5A7U941_CUCMM|nr:retrotransposon protein [Cucumis melo var. makuwa]TYK21373.1 retrotransposon protein [Cucumis melo var. makuwa]
MHNYLGALDDTYIKVNVPASDQLRYRTRKRNVAMNFLGVCDTKGYFVFVLANWEGSTTDSCIIRDAISRPNCLKYGKFFKGPKALLDERGGGNPRQVSSGVGLRQWLEVRQRDLYTWGPFYSSFRWNDELKCIIIEKDVFDDWVKSHSIVKGLLNILFPHYDELSYIFGRDCVMRGRVETFANVGSNVPEGYRGFPADDGNDMEIPSMFIQGLDMMPDKIMGTLLDKLVDLTTSRCKCNMTGGRSTVTGHPRID